MLILVTWTWRTQTEEVWHSSVVNTSSISCCHQRHTHEPVGRDSLSHRINIGPTITVYLEKSLDKKNHRHLRFWDSVPSENTGLIVCQLRPALIHTTNTHPANTRHSPNAVSMLLHRLRLWPNIKTASIGWMHRVVGQGRPRPVRATASLCRKAGICQQSWQ